MTAEKETVSANADSTSGLAQQRQENLSKDGEDESEAYSASVAHYNITFFGKLKPGTTLAEATLALSKIYHTDVSNVQKLFEPKGQAITLARNLTAEKAVRLVELFSTAGLITPLELAQQEDNKPEQSDDDAVRQLPDNSPHSAANVGHNNEEPNNVIESAADKYMRSMDDISVRVANNVNSYKIVLTKVGADFLGALLSGRTSIKRELKDSTTALYNEARGLHTQLTLLTPPTTEVKALHNHILASLARMLEHYLPEFSLDEPQRFSEQVQMLDTFRQAMLADIEKIRDTLRETFGYHKSFVGISGNITPVIETQMDKAATNSQCFIATAAFGTPYHPLVAELRTFRDTVLLKTAGGSWFIAFYNRYSPPLARVVETSTLAKWCVTTVVICPLLAAIHVYYKIKK